MKKIIKKTMLFVGLTTLVATPSFLQARGTCQGKPNMQNALKKLNEAQRSLQKAKQNKKGHRVKGLQLIKKAKEQVKVGCRKAKRSRKRK